MRRRHWWTATVAVILVILAAATWYIQERMPTRLERESASEVVGGLQVKIKDLTHERDTIQMTYVFELDAATPGGGFFRPFGTIDIRCLDAEGRELPDELDDFFLLSEEFRSGRYLWARPWAVLSRRASRFERTTEFIAPNGTKYYPERPIMDKW